MTHATTTVDNWADALPTRTDPPMPIAAPFPGVLTVPCPQCGGPVDVVPDTKVSVTLTPKAAGDGWRTVALTVTASGSTLHTHGRPR